MSQDGLSNFLLRRNHVLPETLEKAQKRMIQTGQNLITELVIEKELDSQKFSLDAATFFDLTLFDLNQYDINFLPHKYFTEKLVKEYHCLPLHIHHKTLLLATSNPLNLNAIKEYRIFSRLNVELVIVDEQILHTYIQQTTKDSKGNALQTLEDVTLEEINLDIIESGDFEKEEFEEDSFGDNDEPIIKYINKIIVDAINKSASDIHFEPYATNFRIRYRLDGLLQKVASPPLKIASRMIARIKIMSHLNIAERRVPQDGRFKLKVSRNHTIDFRISICPTAFGEKAVMRILDQSKTHLGIDKLGFEPHQQNIYLSVIKRSQGMILATGPTGSGKTVTLYAGLQLINTADKNIITAEDPVEINVDGINQVQINNKQGLTFARALKSFLRQDPDIIMVGEIRDYETADIAVKAAQTGHLVLSTVHTNSAPETLNRLIDMGIPHYNITASISLIIAQRLARLLCPHCKQPAPDVTKDRILKMGIRAEYVEQNFTAYQHSPNGCIKCHKGFHGRVAVYQVMPISQTMSRLISEGRDTHILEEQAQKEGIDNLQQAALIKVVKGITSVEEVERIISI